MIKLGSWAILAMSHTHEPDDLAVTTDLLAEREPSFIPHSIPTEVALALKKPGADAFA